MTLHSLPPLPAFLALVEAVDSDAAYRLPLVQEATPLLYQSVHVSAEQAEALSDRFERWRYQILNNRGNNLSPGARELVNVLDLVSCRIKGIDRPPRSPRQALDPGGIDTLIEASLDPRSDLEDLCRFAAEATSRHFLACTAAAGVEDSEGPRRRMLLYAPLYLSSFCINHCLYCGFRYPHELERQHLGRDEVLSQAEFLRQKGFRHILLVAGDFPRLTSRSYLVEMVALLAGAGFSVAVEIAAQTTFAYAHLARAGACGVTLYQETYQEALYNRYHPLGTKVWFDWRLEAPERAAEAGLARLGLGILLGLADSRQDLRALVGHGRYLTNRFPHVRLALSLPRIHEAPEGFEIPFPVDDDMFIRLYCTLRLAFPSAELVLSTREPPALRDRLAAVCITQMSAGSCTVPGGYGTAQQDSPQREQFPVHDQRSPAEVADYLNRAGFAVRWQIS